MITVLAHPDSTAVTRKLAIAAEITVVLALLGAALAALPLTSVLKGGLLEHSLMLLRMVALLLVVTWLMRRAGRSWSNVGLTRPKSLWRVGGLVIGGYLALAALLAVVPPLLQLGGMQPPGLHAFSELRGDLLQYLFFAIPVSWGTAAFIEEMFARGYLLNRIVDLIGSGRAGAWWLAAVAQGALFGLGHFYQGAGGVIMTAMVGITFGLVYLLGRRNLWACIILHGIVDFVSVSAFYFGLVG